MAQYLGNAFSLQMLQADANISVENIDKTDIPMSEVISVVGHSDIAEILGVEVNRVNTRLAEEDILYVAQYISGRLPEGCNMLPEGAEIKYLKVTINYNK